MKSIIEKLFTEEAFSAIEMTGDEFSFVFYAPTDRKKKSYYLVGFIAEDKIKTIASNNETYSRWFGQAIKLAEDNDISEEYSYKNISLILCVESNAERPIQSIFEIEENPYFFRKYVLQYSAKESTALKSYLGDESLLTMLQKLLFDSKRYDAFLASQNLINSNEENDVDTYALASRLCIKLPFLKIEPEDKVSSATLDVEHFLTPDQQELRAKILTGDSNE